MDKEANELTPEALAHRLEALQRKDAGNAERLQALECENTELRQEVSALRRSSEVRMDQVQHHSIYHLARHPAHMSRREVV